MTRLLQAAIASSLVAMAFNAPALGQRTVAVRDPVSCARCTLAVRPEVSLGAPDGPGSLVEVADVGLLKNGSFAVTHGGAPELVVIFSPTGSYLRTVGRKGRGPGEFRYALFARSFGIQLGVVDPLERRVTYFDGDFRPVRTTPIAAELFAPPVQIGDRLVVNGHVRTSERFGFLLHVFDPEGTVQKSFVDSEAGVRFDAPGEVYYRSMSVSSRGTLWIANRTRYKIEEWTADGRLLRSIVRDAAWFEPHAGGDNVNDPAKPKQPRLQDIREDSKGRLWVLTRVAARDWPKALRRVEGKVNPMQQPYVFDGVDRAFDTIVEVIDPNVGKMIASARIDQALGSFLADGRVECHRDEARRDGSLQQPCHCNRMCAMSCP